MPMRRLGGHVCRHGTVSLGVENIVACSAPDIGNEGPASGDIICHAPVRGPIPFSPLGGVQAYRQLWPLACFTGCRPARILGGAGQPVCVAGGTNACSTAGWVLDMFAGPTEIAIIAGDETADPQSCGRRFGQSQAEHGPDLPARL